MTCREKLMLDRPDLVDERYSGGCCGCPSMRGYLSDPEGCGTRAMSEDDCRRCWDREIPETDISNNEKENETMPTDSINRTKMTKRELIEEIEIAHNHIVEMETQLKNLEKYKQYEEAADELKAMHTAFMNSGFTNEQAFDLLKTTMQSMMPTILRGMRL